jgi:Uma2 family endonuclease
VAARAAVCHGCIVDGANGTGSLMSRPEQTRPISVEEYLEGEKYSNTRHEFIDGEIYDMVGATEAHGRISIAFAAALHRHLRGTRCRVLVADMKFRVGDNFYYPDVLVTSERKSLDAVFWTSPVLAIEVLSPGTVAHDTRHKRAAYTSVESLREYALVEQERREIRVIGRSGSGWDTATYTGSDRLHLASVDLTLSLDDIYEDILP